MKKTRDLKVLLADRDLAFSHLRNPALAAAAFSTWPRRRRGLAPAAGTKNVTT